MSKTVPLGPEPAAQPFRFQWNSAGTTLYLEAAVKETRSLWRVRVDPSTLDWLSAARLTPPAGRDVAASVSRDGTRIAFSQQHETSRIWALPLAGASRPRIGGEARPLTEDSARAAFPSLSPDGRRLAYELWRPGIARSELWVMDIDGQTGELLTTNATYPVWSRDGTKVAYHYAREDKEPREWAAAYRPLGGTERFLTPWSSEFIFGPTDWTADGNAVIGTFLAQPRLGGAPTDIALWPTTNPKATRPERVLLRSPKGAQLWCPVLSPNSRWLLFTLLRSGQDRVGLSLELTVAPTAGAPPETWTRIAPGHSWPDKPRWARDGKWILFISKGSTSYLNLWAIPFDSDRGQPVGEPVSLTHFDSPSRVISPDIESYWDISARHAVLEMLTVTGSIWMLDNVDK